jgi:hypothetical protein
MAETARYAARWCRIRNRSLHPCDARTVPSLSTWLVERCVASSLNVFEAFAPDGAWPEGSAIGRWLRYAV